MSVSEMAFVDVMASIDELSMAQCFSVLIALKQNPPEGVDVLKEAVASFEALEDLEVYHFFKELRSRYDEETWATLTED